MATLQAIGALSLFTLPADGFVNGYTIFAFDGSADWCGGQFIAPVTDTITEIHFSTGTVSSPVFQLEAAVTALDSNGYPLGADVAASSTTITNPSATTNYSVTISASVTAGNWYGIILRIKSGTFTSGSANVVFRQPILPSLLPTVSTNLAAPCPSDNGIGSSTKNNGWTTLMPKFSANGWIQVPGISLTSATSNTAVTIAATSGDVAGNKFTLQHAVKVLGYWFSSDIDNPANVEMYSGSDNTAITGSSVAFTPGYRKTTSAAPGLITLASPVTLMPGTYRVGIRNTSAAANTIQGLPDLAEAGIQGLCGPFSIMRSTYSSGAWTDTNTAICGISPIISAFDDGRPPPSFAIGGIA